MIQPVPGEQKQKAKSFYSGSAGVEAISAPEGRGSASFIASLPFSI
jgi:hypothetical protein